MFALDHIVDFAEQRHIKSMRAGVIERQRHPHIRVVLREGVPNQARTDRARPCRRIKSATQRRNLGRQRRRTENFDLIQRSSVLVTIQTKVSPGAGFSCGVSRNSTSPSSGRRSACTCCTLEGSGSLSVA